jgi:hypothetical protein
MTARSGEAMPNRKPPTPQTGPGAADPRDPGPTVCGSRRTKQAGTCTLPAGWGTPHVGTGRCKLHGGSAPLVVAKHQRERAAVAAAGLGLPVSAHPAEVLEAELARANGRVLWLSDYINRQDPASMVWGLAEEVDRGSGEFTGVDRTFKAEPSVWLRLEQQERAHLTKVAHLMMQLGLQWEARRAVDRDGAVLVQVVKAMAARLGYDASDPRVRAAYLAGLRDVIGAEVDPARVIDGEAL